jgi:hypothetical protein
MGPIENSLAAVPLDSIPNGQVSLSALHAILDVPEFDAILRPQQPAHRNQWTGLIRRHVSPAENMRRDATTNGRVRIFLVSSDLPRWSANRYAVE